MSFPELRYTADMKSLLFTATVIAAASIALSAQQQQPKKPKTLTISGCVERDSSSDVDQFTMVDKNEGIKYKLTGKNFREYLGRPVQLDGGIVVKGVRIVGGLQPNPNVAAQAGSLDPSRAAVQAATAASSPGPDIDIQEFRVKEIRPTTGDCK
jgi:hypothetical protein